MANEYSLTISRMTVDKLGVKLYDRVSAVIAELVSNSYDADATEVIVEAPMGEYLASKAGGEITDKGYAISVTDDGIGMSPEQANDYFLKVGAERRTDPSPGRGAKSPKFGRKVMGRKGVGKLAPFGICQIVEVITSGGEEVSVCENGEVISGYRTAHFILDRNEILQDTDREYKLRTGPLDDMVRPSTGTKIVLKNFAYRRVPAHDDFTRQLSHRFGLPSKDWKIMARDSMRGGIDKVVGDFLIDQLANTGISFYGRRDSKMPGCDGSQFRAIGPDLSEIDEFRAGFAHDGSFYPIEGWVAYAKEPYRDDLMGGIRIYCKGKIAAQTAVFNLPAGFHGEYNVRSYLVGALHADWLDDDEDLIQTDRRDILWSHEVGEKFQEWGQSVIRKIGYFTRDPIRKKTWDTFVEVGKVYDRILEAFPEDEQADVRHRAEKLARRLGQTVRGDEVQDHEVVGSIVDLAITLAPHILLERALREASRENTPISVLSNILKTAKLAELLSFGRIVTDRLKVIERLEVLKDDPETAEERLQKLLQDAPWLINPQWSPITSNQAFSTLKSEFEKSYKERTGKDLYLGDFTSPLKRPDFVLSTMGRDLKVVEIKAPGHSLTNEEMERIVTYHDQLKDFLHDPANEAMRRFFDSFDITLVCDSLSLSGTARTAYDHYSSEKSLSHKNWRSFLMETKIVHQDFLAEAERQRSRSV